MHALSWRARGDAHELAHVARAIRRCCCCCCAHCSQSTASIFPTTNQPRRHTHEQTVRDKCFKVCVTSPGSSLSSGEQKCISRCMDRYQDVSAPAPVWVTCFALPRDPTGDCPDNPARRDAAPRCHVWQAVHRQRRAASPAAAFGWGCWVALRNPGRQGGRRPAVKLTLVSPTACAPAFLSLWGWVLGLP